MSWTTSTIGDVLNVIQNGINCKQAKDGVGDKISRIETISDASVNFNKVGYAVLTESEKHKGKLHKNDILFSHINSPIHVGKSALYAEEETLYHGINLLRLRVNDNIDSRFFNYFLNRLFWSGYWKRTAKQSVNQASVNQTDIKVVPFSYPPIPEQRRIVAILDQAFADIEKARANAEKNLKNARELFDSYLNQVLSGENSVIQWKSLDDIVDSVTIGLVKNSREQDPGFDYTYIKMNNIGNNNSFNLFKSSAVNASEEEILKYGLRDNDFLFNTRNSVELVGKNCLYRSWSDAPVLYNNNIARIRFKDEISPAYAAYAFCSPFLKDQLESMKQGTTNVAAIYYKSLKNLKIGYPPIPEQKSIVASLDKLSDKVQQLEKRYQAKLESLDELKKSLLQKAFSGELTKSKGIAA